MHAQARLLARLMSDLSEEYSCAGWLVGTEYALWADLTGSEVQGHKGWGISQYEKEELQVAYDRAGGWIIWPAEAQEVIFLPMTNWLAVLHNVQAHYFA